MQFDQLKRREFITLLGGAVVASLSRVATAQQDRLPLVGVLRKSEGHQRDFRRAVRPLHENSRLERGTQHSLPIRLAEARSDRTPALAGELVAQHADLIIPFGDPDIRAVQRATQTIPIVGMTDDMVGSGLVASLARPGGNTTGVSILASELDVKRLEILHEYVPQARRIAALADPSTISTRPGSRMPRTASAWSSSGSRPKAQTKQATPSLLSPRRKSRRSTCWVHLF